MRWDNRSVIKQHSLPESRSARAACCVPSSSMMLMTAVARRIVICKPPADAQLTIPLIADAEVDGRLFVEEIAVGLGCCSLMG